MKTDLHIIVAMADNGAIGVGGDMPWKMGLKADLKHFKETTMGYPIVMGRKTFESLPKGALPGRTNIVVTRNRSFEAEGTTVAHSLQEALKIAEAEGKERLFLIGGGQLYHQGIELADVLHITLVHHTWEEADTFFPAIDVAEWQCVSSERHEPDEANIYAYTFCRFERIEQKK